MIWIICVAGERLESVRQSVTQGVKKKKKKTLTHTLLVYSP